MIVARFVDEKAYSKNKQAHPGNDKRGVQQGPFSLFARAHQTYAFTLAGDTNDNKKQSSYCRDQFTVDVVMHTRVE